MGLEELGMTVAFDEVYGASAGAVNAAYFLAGQAAYATSLGCAMNTPAVTRATEIKVPNRGPSIDKATAARPAIGITTGSE